ncbi:Outer membrane usher protein fimD precursor [Serratia fonticola]|uniref:Outer membrane usher protein fimD n=1 Tax=Serratia fonticola TaxID=47917 RepID=A0A3S5B1L6_SERFO|nr:Outer membrane usher protein fimD precursor [Serratia fonticola]
MGRIGAISLDITEAQSTLSDDSTRSGQSWRFRYGKSFVETGTNFSLAGYRYSTRGFYTLQETLDIYSSNNSPSVSSINVAVRRWLSAKAWGSQQAPFH